MFMYLTQLGPDLEHRVVSEGDIGMHVSSLQSILGILKSFPLRHYDGKGIFAIARYELSQKDREKMIVFGWDDKGYGWWHPFLKITLTAAVDGKVLWEKVLQESLKTKNIKRRVAIGYD